MAVINYATAYGNDLAQAYPYVLNFGALYNTENDTRYRWVNSKTIEIPSIKVGGRVDSNRDTIATATRNLVSIENITKVMNEEQKFPEMDAYLISKLYSDWIALEYAADTTALTVDNVLTVFDSMMKAMTKKRVTPNGRLLYVTPDVDELIKNAKQISRTFDVQGATSEINRAVKSLDSVKINVVPPELMLTAYNFTNGWAAGASAKQIKMFLVHPNAVITPVSYQFSQLDPPSAGSEGKWIYFEESFEDVFILNKKADALQFVVSDTLEVESDAGEEST